eukprot:jgi/Picsp_1/2405/NSC_05866-R1_hypothetical protein COCSUDRAFT_64726 [Coccomyxa subellipsoidea C-169]
MFMSKRQAQVGLGFCALWLFCLRTCSGLSWPVCEDGGSVWVTERPSKSMSFPGANFWFFCEGSFNIVGSAVAACLAPQGNSSDPVCDFTSAMAACKLLGYDRLYEDGVVIARASPAEPVMTLNGLFCLREGIYASEIPDNLETLDGEPCEKIDSITCVRSIEKIEETLKGLNLSTVNEDLEQEFKDKLEDKV